MSATTPEHIRQGLAELAYIVQLHAAQRFLDEHPDLEPDHVDALNAPEIDGYPITDADALDNRIRANAASIEYRSGWEPGDVWALPEGGRRDVIPPAELRIVLASCPHVELRADADGSGAELRAQDGLTPLERVPLYDPNDPRGAPPLELLGERQDALNWYAGLHAWPTA